MRLRIVGDGTYPGTRIIDADTGEQLTGIRDLEIVLNPDEQSVTMHMVRGVGFDMSVEKYTVEKAACNHPQLVCAKCGEILKEGTETMKFKKPEKFAWAGANGKCTNCGTEVELDGYENPETVRGIQVESVINSPAVWMITCPVCSRGMSVRSLRVG